MDEKKQYKAMPVSEERWRDGLGQRYMADGLRTRCQAVTKTFLRKERLLTGNADLTSADVWPRGQCTRSAVEGAFLCRYHGGRTPGMVPKSPEEFMPVDLQEKVRLLGRDPDYLNRKDEIVQLRARNVELFESLEDDWGGGREAWETILEGVRMIRGAEPHKGVLLIESVVLGELRRDEVWEEIRQNNKVISQLTNTQTRTMKEMGAMMSTSQVMALVDGMSRVVMEAINEFVEDDHRKELLMGRIGGGLRGLVNARLGRTERPVLEAEVIREDIDAE